MLRFIEDILLSFRGCFSRRAAFHWFVLVVTGFLFRGDQLGVTSIIRDLSLDPACYELLIHFFHSDAWEPSRIRKKWYEVLAGKAPRWKVNGKTVLAGDGVKQYKEAFYMAGVKKLFQESENISKPEYIFGHLFGAVGLLAGNASHCFCIPLRMDIQDGLKEASSWTGSGISASSHVIQMIDCGTDAAGYFGHCLFVLDRYFLSVPALKRLMEWNSRQKGDTSLSIVTKAKASCIAYEKPPAPDARRRGRPRKKGSSVKLVSLFNNMEDRFQHADVIMYGAKKRVHYYVTDLLWGKGLYQELRFVLVKYDGLRSILVSSDLSLSPEQIIEVYAHRAKIEDSFRQFKQNLGGFGYHFWTKSLPRLDHFAKKGDPDPLSTVSDDRDRRKILNNIHAIEGFVLFACIAMGILQLVSLSDDFAETVIKKRYLRTPSNEKPSEASVMYYLRRMFFLLLLNAPDSAITKIIRSRQEHPPGEKLSKTG
ncbi:MAG: transposase [Eubacteriales bacterium]|nr:transposase [Eubacteriales bacterium]